jgi:hypothetical protein
VEGAEDSEGLPRALDVEGADGGACHARHLASQAADDQVIELDEALG